MSPTFSIIIPVYNVAPYLRECLDSIILQSYSNWETICVDDGSTDNSLEVLEVYAKKDCRIKIYHQENKGVSSARNNALKRINGDYFTFVDGDDVIQKDMLELWYKVIVQYKPDILVEGDGSKRVSSKEIHDIIKQQRKRDINAICFLNTHDALSYAYGKATGEIGEICSKAYKTSLFGKCVFDENFAVGEDYVFLCSVAQKDVKWCFVDTISYLYRLRENSVIFSMTPIKRLNALVAAEKVLEILSKYNVDKEVRRHYWLTRKSGLVYLVRGPEDCWKRLSSQEKKIFSNAISQAHRLLGFYPFDFIMRIRFEYLHGTNEWIPYFLEYLFGGVQHWMQYTFAWWKNIKAKMRE